MPKLEQTTKIFSALEVAELCGVVNQTVINWIKQGYLKAFTTPGGQYRVYAGDLAAFLNTQGMADTVESLVEGSEWTTLLIAMDDRVLNDRLKKELKPVLPGYDIVQALDCFETGIRLSRTRPGFVLVDSAMQGLDIERFVRILKDEPYFGNPFILIMEGSNALPKAADDADALLGRPPDLLRLVETIRSLSRHARQ